MQLNVVNWLDFLKKFDLVFSVEHTGQGKVLHTQLQVIFGEKAVKNK